MEILLFLAGMFTSLLFAKLLPAGLTDIAAGLSLVLVGLYMFYATFMPLHCEERLWTQPLRVFVSFMMLFSGISCIA